MPAQPVDATPSNRLIGQYFPSRIDLYGSIQLKPKQGSVLFESTLANVISLVDSYKRTSSKCCIDPLRPPVLSECGPPAACTHNRASPLSKARALRKGGREHFAVAIH